MRKNNAAILLVICIVSEMVVNIVFENKQQLPLLYLVTMGVIAGVGVGAAAEIMDRGDMLSRLFNGFIGNTIYGAAIGGRGLQLKIAFEFFIRRGRLNYRKDKSLS